MALPSFSQELCQYQNERKGLDLFIGPEKENWCRVIGLIRQLGNLIALVLFQFGGWASIKQVQDCLSSTSSMS